MIVRSTPIRAMIAALLIGAAAPVALHIGEAVRSFVMFRRLATAALLSIAFITGALAADTKPHRVAIYPRQIEWSDGRVRFEVKQLCDGNRRIVFNVVPLH